MVYEENSSDLNVAVALLTDAMYNVFDSERVNDMQLENRK